MNNGIYYAAGNGDDWVVAASKSDILIGDAGNDAFDGKGGGDYLEGGTGTDTDTFSSMGKSIFIDLLKAKMCWDLNISANGIFMITKKDTLFHRVPMKLLCDEGDKAKSGSAVWLV